MMAQTRQTLGETLRERETQLRAALCPELASFIELSAAHRAAFAQFIELAALYFGIREECTDPAVVAALRRALDEHRALALRWAAKFELTGQPAPYEDDAVAAVV